MFKKSFIKLTNVVINTRYITKIYHNNNCYSIYTNENSISGFFIFYFGTISSNQNIIHILSEKDPENYKIIDDWINSKEENE